MATMSIRGNRYGVRLNPAKMLGDFTADTGLLKVKLSLTANSTRGCSDGYIYAYDVKTGKMVWKWSTGSSGFETAYGVWPDLFFYDHGCRWKALCRHG